MKRFLAQALAAALFMPTAVEAAQPYACGGAALAGGAQLICSHIDPTAPPQSCPHSLGVVVLQSNFVL